MYLDPKYMARFQWLSVYMNYRNVNTDDYIMQYDSIAERSYRSFRNALVLHYKKNKSMCIISVRFSGVLLYIRIPLKESPKNASFAGV